MKAAPILLTVVSTAIVVVSVLLDVQDTSPGPIAAVHAQAPELRDTNNCALCHGDRSTNMRDACLDCHQIIAKQLEGRSGFHGVMKDGLADACAKCHSEHHGRNFPITNSGSFSLAGITSNEQVHDDLNFQLIGKHTRATCEACHPNAIVPVLEKGTTRFIGLDQRCTSCHEDVHQGSYGQDCNSCHGQEQAFAKAPEFQHTQAFELIGFHAQVGCVACHEKGTEHAVDVLLAIDSEASHSANIRTCVDCHPSPHSIDFLTQISTLLSTQWSRSCEHCHPPTHTAFHAPEATLTQQQHACSGFSLEPPHHRITCEGCHQGFGEQKLQQLQFLAAFPGRDADDCRACHGDPHYGQFERGLFRGRGCLTCHQRHTFTPDFDVADHRLTAFPLHGAHANVACENCHKVDPNPPSPTADTKVIVARTYYGTPQACRACHPDPHKGQFGCRENRSADCNACHDERSFRQSTFDVAAHARTDFPLTGAHEAVGCNSCHVETDQIVGGLAARRRIFNGTARACSACHEDVHGGVFERRGLPTELDGRQGCARCHTTTSFSGIRVETFDHGRWTGYALTGAHARAQCVACHRPTPPDELGRAFGRVISRDCQSCHVDPHLGQFGATETVNCAQCHLEGDRFSDLRFDHQTQSIFPLDETHVGLACTACHKRQRLSNGLHAIRYKPLGTQCGDCHVPRGPVR